MSERSQPSRKERRFIVWWPDHSTTVVGDDTNVAGSVAVQEVVPIGDLIAVIQAKAEIVSTLDTLIKRAGDARRLLTPGMKAGVAEAAALLDSATQEAQDAL